MSPKTKGRRSAGTRKVPVAEDKPAWTALRDRTLRHARDTVRSALSLRGENKSAVDAIEEGARALFASFPADARANARAGRDGEAARVLEGVRAALAALRDLVDRNGVQAGPAVGEPPVSVVALRARRYFDDYGRNALAGLGHPVRLPVDPSAAWEPADLLLVQMWPAMNGGRGHCRACDAKLSGEGGCVECGADPMTARGPAPKAGMWWRGKTKPRDLAILIVLGGAVTDAGWKKWARDGEVPRTVLEALALRLRVRIADRRKSFREWRRAGEESLAAAPRPT